MNYDFKLQYANFLFRNKKRMTTYPDFYVPLDIFEAWSAWFTNPPSTLPLTFVLKYVFFYLIFSSILFLPILYIEDMGDLYVRSIFYGCVVSTVTSWISYSSVSRFNFVYSRLWGTPILFVEYCQEVVGPKLLLAKADMKLLSKNVLVANDVHALEISICKFIDDFHEYNAMKDSNTSIWLSSVDDHKAECKKLADRLDKLAT